MTQDPYIRWKETALWRTLTEMLRRLAADGHIQLGQENDSMTIVRGELCSALDFYGHTAGTRFALVRATLERLRSDGFTIEEDDVLGLALEACALIDNDATEQELAAHIAKYEADAGDMPEHPMHDLMPIARALVLAYREGQ